VERLVAHKGQAVTQTGLRTGLHVIQPLVVTLRTLRPAVTHVVRVKTDLGVQTAIETWALEDITIHFILTVQAVKASFAARVHRQAQSTLANTVVVRLRTRVVQHFLLREKAVLVEVNDGWKFQRTFIQ
jgi:hypothetical protein